MMRSLVRPFGLDLDRICTEYALAESQGKVQRPRNRYKLTERSICTKAPVRRAEERLAVNSGEQHMNRTNERLVFFRGLVHGLDTVEAKLRKLREYARNNIPGAWHYPDDRESCPEWDKLGFAVRHLRNCSDMVARLKDSALDNADLASRRPFAFCGLHVRCIDADR